MFAYFDCFNILGAGKGIAMDGGCGLGEANRLQSVAVGKDPGGYLAIDSQTISVVAFAALDYFGIREVKG